MTSESTSSSGETARLASLTLHLQEFGTTLDALQDFLDTIAPHVQSLDQQRSISTVVAEMVQQLSGEARERALRDMGQFTAILGEAIDEEVSKETGEASAKSTAVSEHGARIIWAAVQAGIAKPKLPILLRSMVPMAVGAFEVLIGHLLTTSYHFRSGLIERDQKEFSLADLEQFATVQEAFNDAVQRRVENVLNGGLDEWTKWFSKRGIDIEMSRLALDWPETLELFQRRHIIIHNAGIVSKRYLAKLTGQLDDLPSLGSTIITDAEYVQNGLDNLNVLGYLMTAFVQKRLSPGTDRINMASRLRRDVGTLMRQERWRAAQKICLVSKSIKEYPEDARLTFQCEEWLCTKKLDGLDAIRAEVEAWDASALGHRFQAMRYALLDMEKEAGTALQKALTSDEVSKLEVSFTFLLQLIQDSIQPDANNGNETQ